MRSLISTYGKCNPPPLPDRKWSSEKKFKVRHTNLQAAIGWRITVRIAAPSQRAPQLSIRAMQEHGE